MPLEVSVEDTQLYADSDIVRDQLTAFYILSQPSPDDICGIFGFTKEYAESMNRMGMNPFPMWFRECIGLANRLAYSDIVIQLGPNTFIAYSTKTDE